MFLIFGSFLCFTLYLCLVFLLIAPRSQVFFVLFYLYLYDIGSIKYSDVF